MGISVILPTYNRSHIIERAINSVRQQTYTEWELLVVDDCSKDNTAELIRKLSETDPRIKLIVQEKNQGAPAARNKGAAIAIFGIFVFLDSDDEFHPNYFEELTKKYESLPELGMIYTGADIYHNGILIKRCHQMVRGKLEKYLFEDLKGLGGLSGLAVKREVYNAIGGFDVNCKSQQDLDIYVRIAANYEIDYVENCHAKIHSDSNQRISDNSQSVIDGNVYFFKKYKDRLIELDLYHHVARKLARRYAKAKQLKNAYKLLFEAIKFKPSYLYAYIYALKLPILYFKGKL